MRHSIQSAPQIMDLSRFSLEELEDLLKVLPEEIHRRESVDDEAELRKRRLFLDFQELAAKQGMDLSKL
jgi:hypothetical protein